jgi:hypothetical protein
MSINFNLDEHSKKMNNLFKDGKTLTELAKEKPIEEIKFEEIPCYACQGGGCPTCNGYGHYLQPVKAQSSEPKV